MIHVETRQAVHPDHARAMDTAALRRHFLAEGIFAPGEIRLVYTHYDRFVVGAAVPDGAALVLDRIAETKTATFLERREMGVVNIGGPGRVEAGGQGWDMAQGDVLYLGMGAGPVTFSGQGRFYITSCPAHRALPARLVTVADAKEMKTGAVETSNKRTIRQFIHPLVMESCQLVLGYTTLEDGSVWNTMPPHLHERRMEAYCYFDLAPEDRVMHFMGRPDNTRHLVVANGDMVLSPAWSIHMGAGTGRYAFVWGMTGENQAYGDVDPVAVAELR